MVVDRIHLGFVSYLKRKERRALEETTRLPDARKAADAASWRLRFARSFDLRDRAHHAPAQPRVPLGAFEQRVELLGVEAARLDERLRLGWEGLAPLSYARGEQRHDPRRAEREVFRRLAFRLQRAEELGAPQRLDLAGRADEDGRRVR